MMYKNAFLLFLAGLLVLTISCKGKVASEEKPIVRINDYIITEKDFRQELSASAHFHDITGLTQEDKKDFLNSQIKKELLIQAAVSLGLDKEEGFRQAIENYWEQTLITALLKREISRLEKDIIVTREEIENLYHHMSQTNPDISSLEKILPALEKEIREEKKTRALESWIKDLWMEAEITIYEENLRAMR